MSVTNINVYFKEKKRFKLKWNKNCMFFTLKARNLKFNYELKQFQIGRN